MANINIQINFDVEDVPFGSDKPIKTENDYNNHLEARLREIFGGLYPGYQNLNVETTTTE